MRAPGLYADVPEAEYHADDAASQSSLKALLDCPARYRWERDHPRPQTASMSVGTAVHRLLLGQPLERPRYVVDADSWRTRRAKRARHVAEALGHNAVLASKADEAGELDVVRAAAEAVLAHPEARTLLEREGASEVSAWWVDERTGIACRGRIDRLNDVEVLDLKTTKDASPVGFARSCVAYGYAEQAAFYRAGLASLGADYPPMRFIAVQATAPHLVAVYGLDREWIDHAADRMADALDLLATCRATDEWPGYPSTTLSHPYWKA